MNGETEVRQVIKDLSAYSLDQPDCRVKLNQNENPFGLPEAFQKEMGEVCAKIEWNRYPECDGKSFREPLARRLGVDPDMIVLGNGSNELLMAVMMTLLEPGRRLVVVEPTFSLYRHLGRLTGADIEVLPFEGAFEFPIEKLEQAMADSRTALSVFCSPNNPTGSVLSFEQAQNLLRSARGVLLIDEAYVEFSSQDFLPLLEEYPNLILARTLSKAWAFAGIRLGYILSRQGLAEQVTKALLPFRISRLTLEAGKTLLKYEDWIKGRVREIVKERAHLYRALDELEAIRVYSSQANFILTRPEQEAQSLYNELVKESILVRDVSGYPFLDNHLRMSVGTPEENNLLIKTVKSLLGEQ
jgi:histidinol-phosphate aminotransferase